MAIAVTPANRANKTQNFYPANDMWRMTEFPVKASTAIAEGALVAIEVSGSSPTGNITLAATTNANGQNLVGIIAEPIAATDSDYATAGKKKFVWIPTSPEAKAFFTVGAGTFTAADVGRTCQIHTDSVSLAVDTNGLGASISDYISSTRGICKLNIAPVVTA